MAMKLVYWMVVWMVLRLGCLRVVWMDTKMAERKVDCWVCLQVEQMDALWVAYNR